MSVVITCFELPPTAASPVPPLPGRAVHRAIAADARFGYIAVDTAPGLPGLPALPAPALSGHYEVIHEGHDAAPSFGGEPGEPIIFVNCMQFPVGREDEAFDFWLRVNEYMVRKPGYRWHRLHRRMADSAPFGQINVVEWESVESWEAAHDDGFRALTVRPDIPFTAVPTVCRTVAVAVGA